MGVNPGGAAQGVVAVIPRQERLLLIRRSRHVVAPGAWCFPGGALEAGETEAEALIREVGEELGARVTPARRLWGSITPWRVSLAWWLADLELHSPLVPNPAEVAAVAWLTLDEMAALPGLLESNRHFLAAVSEGAVELPFACRRSPDDVQVGR